MRVLPWSIYGPGRGRTFTTTTALWPCWHSSQSRPVRAGWQSSRTPCPPHIKTRGQYPGSGQNNASSTSSSLLSSLSSLLTSSLPSSSSPSMSSARLSLRTTSIRIRSPALTLLSRPDLCSFTFRMKPQGCGKFGEIFSFLIILCSSQLSHLATRHFTSFWELCSAPDYPQHFLLDAQISRGPPVLCWHPQLSQPSLHHTLHDRGHHEDFWLWSQGLSQIKCLQLFDKLCCRTISKTPGTHLTSSLLLVVLLTSLNLFRLASSNCSELRGTKYFISKKLKFTAN